MNILTSFPDESMLISMYPQLEVLNGNAHIHTPFSFSSFDDIQEIFEQASKEQIALLGINDFFVSDGYTPFYEGAVKKGIFPLFNIEFIGLMKKEQQAGIRINDPNNPGRCYFCGKGLDYPFKTNQASSDRLKSLISLSQEQVMAMITKLNGLLQQHGSGKLFSYTEIRDRFARNLVRERHLAKAVRTLVFESYPDSASRIDFLERLFGGKPVQAQITDIPALENEIRSNLLKAGGLAYVEEDESTFLPVNEIKNIILSAGGIPCYPVLLDDKNGSYTEFESSPESLFNELSGRHISCMELIPGRNDSAHLEKFVDFFHDKNFIILMGTEHNTPEKCPLTCDTRGKKPLSERMKRISYEGACIIAAHQYLRSKAKPGYVNSEGIPNHYSRDFLVKLGNAAIHYFNNKIY